MKTLVGAQFKWISIASPSVLCSRENLSLSTCTIRAVDRSRAARGIGGGLSSLKLQTRRSRKSSTFSLGTLQLSADSTIHRRVFINQSVVAGLLVCNAALAEVPTKVVEMDRLPYREEGYTYWTWQDHKVHYVVQGEGKPMVLIHGFGASAFHWRYNIPELARQGYKVYAMDLLGFGWTEKALVDYSPSLWKDQVADFLREVVGEPAALVGNSIGGFTVLYTGAMYPDLVSGVALLNASGQFDTPAGTAPMKPVVEQTAVQRLFVTPVKDFARRWAIAFAFWQAKQPARIKSVLQNVYKDTTNVDDYLVQSIIHPTKDTNAGEAYYRMMTNFLMKSSSELTLNKLLGKLQCPLLLLWGDLDPWMGAGKVDKFLELYPSATLVRLQAGHCPQDEAPEASNKALINWASTL